MAPADDFCPFTKDTVKSPKKSPVAMRMVVLISVIVFGVFICLICLRRISVGSTTHLQNIQMPKKPCEIEPDEKPYLHFPRPTTFDRDECECSPVRSFAIVSTQRSGSGWFETLLNSHTNVSSNGEIFSVKDRRNNFSTIVETLDKVYNLDWMSSASKNDCTAAVGLKWMLNQGLMQHHVEIVDYFKSNGVSAIFLFRRNLLRRMVSILANSYDQSTKPLNGTHKSHVHSPEEAKILASYKPTINTTLLLPNLMQADDLANKSLLYFKSTRHIVLYYEDILKNQTKLADVQDFLGVPQQKLKSRQVKIHKGSLSSQVENWGDIEKALKGTRYESYLNDD